MNILSVESSCDETAVAITCGRKILSSVIASQIDEHALYGGVVPEIASRRHTESLISLTNSALSQANLTLKDIGAIAVTYAPGLIGALLVGVNYCKGLCLSLGVPLIPVHHIRGHIAANYNAYSDLQPPFLALCVSGGHSHIVMVERYTKFKVIGATRDDACGECFDKSARAMGLPYPGGVHLDRLAESGDSSAFKLPRPTVENSRYDFSFSGLKTSVINILHKASQKNETVNHADLAACVRKRVVEMLCDNTFAACKDLGQTKIVLAGGVSANSLLRSEMVRLGEENNIKIYLPPPALCGDNAAMIGIQAHYELEAGYTASMDLNAYASMSIEKNYV